MADRSQSRATLGEAGCLALHWLRDGKRTETTRKCCRKSKQLGTLLSTVQLPAQRRKVIECDCYVLPTLLSPLSPRSRGTCSQFTRKQLCNICQKSGSRPGSEATHLSLLVLRQKSIGTECGGRRRVIQSSYVSSPRFSSEVEVILKLRRRASSTVYN